MQTFVEDHNIENFTDQLKVETDPVKRATLIKLLAEEEAKRTLTLANGRPLSST